MSTDHANRNKATIQTAPRRREHRRTGADLQDHRRAHRAVEDLIAEGDKVVDRNTVTGTHHGEYMDLQPTGKSATYKETFIVRFANTGRIAETCGVVDVFSQLRQLGAFPT